MKNTIIGVVGAVAIVAGLYLAWRSQKVLEDGLPPKFEHVDQAAALKAAQKHGGAVVSVLGTGSMAPYIPAAAAGRDPMQTVVAYAVSSPRTYDDVTPGALCVYRAEWTRPPGGNVIHGAAQRLGPAQGEGWVMSGLHNEASESSWRMTRANFVCLIAEVHTWKQ